MKSNGCNPSCAPPLLPTHPSTEKAEVQGYSAVDAMPYHDNTPECPLMPVTLVQCCTRQPQHCMQKNLPLISMQQSGTGNLVITCGDAEAGADGLQDTVVLLRGDGWQAVLLCPLAPHVRRRLKRRLPVHTRAAAQRRPRQNVHACRTQFVTVKLRLDQACTCLPFALHLPVDMRHEASQAERLQNNVSPNTGWPCRGKMCAHPHPGWS